MKGITFTEEEKYYCSISNQYEKSKKLDQLTNDIFQQYLRLFIGFFLWLFIVFLAIQRRKIIH